VSRPQALSVPVVLLIALLATAPAAAAWTITADTTWTAGVVVPTDDVVVPAGVTLTLEPGVIVKFAIDPPNDSTWHQLKVQGSLVAVGTADAPIVFTSYRDDTWGGDTNGDGDATVPRTYGDWWGIVFTGDSLHMAHCQVHYAMAPSGQNAGVSLWGPSLMEDCLFTDSVYPFLAVRADSAIVRRCTFQRITPASRYLLCYADGTLVEDCAFMGAPGHDDGERGIEISSSGSATVTGTTFSDLEEGVFTGYGRLSAADCTFTDCRYPLFVAPGCELDLADLHFAGSGYRAAVLAALWSDGHSLRWSAAQVDSLPLLINPEGRRFTIESGDTLSLGPGAVLKIPNGGYMFVEYGATLLADGTAEAPVAITSLYDDTWGGDTDGGTGSVSPNGLWRYIRAPWGASVRLRHAVVRYGGNNSSSNPMLDLECIALVEDCRFDNAYRPLLSMEGGAGSIVRRCEFGPAREGLRTSMIDTLSDCVFHDLVHACGTMARVVTGNRVRDCYLGFDVRGIYSVVTENVLENVTFPFLVENGAWVDPRDNTLAGTTPELLYLQGTWHHDLALETFDRPSWTYLATDLTIDADRTFSLAPGVILKMWPDRSVNCQGRLAVNGTADRPVVITSYHDNEFGVAIYGSDDQPPAAGDWGRIQVDQEAVLSHAILRYGSSAMLLLKGTSVVSGVTFQRADGIALEPYGHLRATVQDCDFSGPGGTLLAARGDTVLVRNCRFTDADYGVVIDPYGPGPALVQDCLFRDIVRNALFIRCNHWFDTPLVLVGNGVAGTANQPAFYIEGVRAPSLVAGNSVRGRPGIDCRSGNPLVEANLLAGGGTGVGLNVLSPPLAGPALMQIAGNVITGYGCGVRSMGTWPDRQVILELTGNRIGDNTGSGIHIGATDSLSYLPPALTATGNDLSGNGAWDLYAGGCPDPAAQVVVARENWWGVTGTAVADRIHDQTDDPAAPLVLADPVLAAPPALPDTVRWAAPLELAVELLPDEAATLTLWTGHRDSATAGLHAALDAGGVPPAWAAVTPADTTLAPARSAPLAVAVTAAGLADGVYQATVRLAWDGAGKTLVPLTVTVGHAFLDGPDAGRILHPGDTVALAWRAWQPDRVTAVDLDLSTDGGTTFPLVVAAGLADTTAFAWTVPPGVSSEECRLRLTVHYDDGTVYRYTDDAVFTILDRDVVVIEDPDHDDDPPAPLPQRLALLPCRPNPFNPATELAFDLPRPGRAVLAVYDLAGRRVRVLLDADLPAGRHSVRWDGRDGSGRAVASGTYLARLTAGGGVRTQRLTLAR